MTNTRLGRSTAYWLLAGATLAAATPSFAAEGRKIEEVVITAERTESTVQDAAISITAFSDEFIEDFGLRNQEDLQNYTPATTIQPYDIAIRGVGRLFRTIGGDPGVATYLNGVYSEDFLIASTEGGLFDIERVEILRGPQGTLYGRNAVGGAVNFINTRPKNNFEGEARVVGGTGGLFEVYGLINQPLIDDTLIARVVGSKRKRDGYINDTGPFESSINNYGDENYSLALLYTPTDTLTFQVRGNERSYARKFNGGAGTSPLVTSQNGTSQRDTTSLVFGYTPVAGREQEAGNCSGATLGAGQFCFNHPNGDFRRIVTRVRPGIDQAAPIHPNADPDGAGTAFPNTVVAAVGGTRNTTSASSAIPNYAWGAAAFDLLSQPQDVDDLTSDSLEVATSGQYQEFFDHQAIALNGTWEISDSMTLRYNGGYTDYFYDRTTDEDKGANHKLGSYDFYVIQSNENWQHEVLLEMDFGDNLTVTTGAFIYQNHSDQTLDLYDPIDTQGRFRNPTLYPAAGLFGAGGPFAGADNAARARNLAALLGGDGVTRLDINSAQRAFEAGATLDAEGTVSLLNAWLGDPGDGLPGGKHGGESTPGTFFAWDNTLETRATAVYFQAEWRFADAFALTVGARYAKDEKEGEERILTYLELPQLNGLFGGLETFNRETGALTAGGTPACLPTAASCAGTQAVRFNGVPVIFNSYLPLEKDWDKITGRVNLEWEPNDYSLVYVSATSGWRSGGFNLGFRSTNNPIYDPENVYAYEIGYKSQLLDNTLQLNMSAYMYMYKDIQQIVNVLGQFGAGTAVTNAPEAQTFGFEGEVLWIPTDSWTLGGNWSYTHAEFTQSFVTIDNDDPSLPSSVFSPSERSFDADGNSLSYIPEYKFSLFSTYNFPLEENGNIDWLLSIAYSAEFDFNINNSEFDKAPELWRVDTRVTWTSADEAVTATLGVNNVLDELGARDQQRFNEFQGGFLRASTPNDPRLIYAELRYKFGE